MATKNKKLRNKKNKGFVFYAFLGFGVLFVILTVILIMLDSATLDYSDFDHFDDFSETLTQPELEYLVYYYSEGCGACITIKDEMMSFADSNSYGMHVYFIDAYDVSGVDYYGFNLTTPTMLMILNGEIAQTLVGPEQIIDTLLTIEAYQ